MWVGDGPGNVKHQEPEEDHDAEHERGELRQDLQDHGRAGGDQAYAGEVGPENVSGNPCRDEHGDEGGVEEVVDAEGYDGDGEEEAADGHELLDERLARRGWFRERAGHEPGAAAHGQGFEGVGPGAEELWVVGELGGDVVDDDEDQKDYSRDGRYGSCFDIEEDGEACGDMALLQRRRPGEDGRESMMATPGR